MVSGVHIEGRRLHLNRQHVHGSPLLPPLVAQLIEYVAGYGVAGLEGDAVFFSGGHNLAEQVKAGAWRILSRKIKGVLIPRVGGGRQSNQDVSYLDAFVESARRTDADDVFHIEFREQLPGVDAHGRHAHAAALDADRDALIGSRKTVHVADFRIANRAVQKVFSDKLGSQRVSRHEDCLCDLAFFGSDV